MNSLKNKYPTLGKYMLIKTLGSGYNSKVKLGFAPSTNKYCAVKIIKHSHPQLNIDTIHKEIEVLSNLQHPNIVNLIEFHESAEYVKKNGQKYKAVAIVMELVPGGELFEYVASSGRFSEEVSRTYFRSLIETLEFIYSKGITHRDLKPENLLFDANFNLKVADFGFATLLSGKDGSGFHSTPLGTESYMAPEIHLRQPYKGESVDLFASAIILFIMISGNPPFAKADPRSDPHYKLIHNNKLDVFWNAHEKSKQKVPGQNFYSVEFRDLISAMLASDPNSRPNIEQIKSHSWYNGPIVDSNTLKAEFSARKKKVDDAIQKQREAKLKEKQKNQPTMGAFYGFNKPFRSSGEEKEAAILKDLEDIIDFDAPREFEEYITETGFKAYTEVFTVMEPKALIRLLCVLCKTNKIEFTLSENKYKIKGTLSSDDNNCGIVITLSKVDDITVCIEFRKTAGNISTFYEVIDSIKTKIPELETKETKETSNNTEAPAVEAQ